ncbi:MAG: hypothetical protein ABIR24_13630 [Verrucomicrobiota bacterium]
MEGIMLALEMSARYFDKNNEQDPSESWTSETACQARIVLTQARRRRLYRKLSVEDSVMNVCAELVDTGHLDGWVTLGSDGRPCKVIDIRVTSLGQEYLEGFKDEVACPISLIPEQVLWLVKGVAVAVLFMCLLLLTPEATTRAGKFSDRGPASFPVAEIVPSLQTETARVSDHSQARGTPTSTAESSRIFQTLCVRCSRIE